jgi:hypothetical protein
MTRFQVLSTAWLVCASAAADCVLVGLAQTG